MTETIQYDGFINEEDAASVSAGRYIFKVERYEQAITKSSGLPMVELHLRLFNSNLDPAGKIYDNLVLTKSAMWKLCAFYRTIGMKKHGQPIQMNWPMTVGKFGFCDVMIEEYEGKKRPKIAQYVDREYVDDLKLVEAMKKAGFWSSSPKQEPAETSEEIPF